MKLLVLIFLHLLEAPDTIPSSSGYCVFLVFLPSLEWQLFFLCPLTKCWGSTVCVRLSSLFTLHISSPPHAIYSNGLKYQLNANDSQICIFSSDLACVSDPCDTYSKVSVTQPLARKGTYFRWYFKPKGQKNSSTTSCLSQVTGF